MHKLKVAHYNVPAFSLKQLGKNARQIVFTMHTSMLLVAHEETVVLAAMKNYTVGDH